MSDATDIQPAYSIPEGILPADSPFDLVTSYNGNTNKFMGYDVRDRRLLSPHGMMKIVESFENLQDALQWCAIQTAPTDTTTPAGTSGDVLPMQGSLF